MSKNVNSNDIKGETSLNAFTLLMSNRHNQNEILNEVLEKQTDESSEECDSDSGASICSVEEVPKKDTQLYSSKVLVNGKNAFEYLMMNHKKLNNPECEEHSGYDSSPNSKSKHKTNLKFKFNSCKNRFKSLDDSIEDFEVKSDDEIFEASVTKSRKYVENILISPSDLKSKLINEVDKIDIEETFKEEIQECFLRKKKKRKKRYNKKKRITKNLTENSKETLLSFSGSDDELFPKSTSKSCKSSGNQLGIKSFFKPTINNGRKNSINNKNNNNNATNNIKHGIIEQVSQNSILEVNNKFDKVSPDEKRKDDQYGGEKLGSFKNRLPCLKQKSKLPQEIKVQEFRKKNETDDETEIVENYSDTLLKNTEDIKEDSCDSDLDSNSKLNSEHILCDIDFIHNSGNDVKLRRSSRTIKKPKPFEIFQTPQRMKSKTTENDLSGDFCTERKTKSTKYRDGSSNNENENFKASKSKRKRKNKERKARDNGKDDSPVVQEISLDEPELIIISDSPDSQGKNHQLAPIFMKKKKIEISPTKLQARKDFFYSDVSETLKKASIKNAEEQALICPFPKFTHVRQLEDSEPLWKLPSPHILSLNEYTEKASNFPLEEFSNFNKISEAKSENIIEEQSCPFPRIDEPTVCHCLVHYKTKFKDFPVLSTFKSFLESKKDYINYYEEFTKVQKLEILESTDNNQKQVTGSSHEKKCKRKKGNKYLSRSKRRRILQGSSDDYEDIPDEIWHKWMPFEWTQVFSPKSADFVVGNIGSVIRLKEFLTKWKSAFKNNDLSDNESSNMSDESYDNHESVVNAVLISGPPGIGKTATVYALAQDLGYRVLEINASSSRQGKQLMGQLAEATQSHNVRTVSFLFGCVNQPVYDNIESDEKGKSMSLILIEDIDIVFEDLDEGFWNAVNTLLCTSKRPIIFTTSLDVAYPIPKIKERYEEIIFETPDSKCIAQYLQLMCLANGVFTCSKEIEHLVKSNKNDIRKCILDLQFWVMSGKSSVAWWQVNNESNYLCVLSDKKENDVMLLDIFPDASKFSNKCVRIPICTGSIWSKEDAKFLNAPVIIGNRSEKLNWTLTSANCDSLLPFTKTDKIKHFKYPLTKDDPNLKKHSLWQKHKWLSFNSDSDVENEESSPETREKVEEKIIPKELCHDLDTYNDSLSRFFSLFTDFDVLSSRSYLSQKHYFHEFHNNWWTPSIVEGLETDIISPLSCYYNDNLNSDLIPELSHLNLKYITRRISNIITKSAENMFLNLETSNNSSIMEPHFRVPLREQNNVEKLNQILSSELPQFNQLNRMTVVVDYIPFLREIARSDHVGEAIQKLKRSRRFIKHFNNLEIYSLSSSELLKLCNVFNSN